MSTEPAAEADIEKLREWVDDLRIKQPLEAPLPPNVGEPNPQVKVLKAPYEPTEGAKRVQKIIESMDLRRQERARLCAQGNSKRVLFQRETDADQKEEEARIVALNQEWAEKINAIKAQNAAKARGRQWELEAITAAVAKLDLGLANFRKQLDAELLKLDPERGSE